ncbi:iron-sulfur cluster co-chaperone protein HscB isoform X2 [Paramormyrops kingsleyae]|uniref:iron-sulfur cluster co-chaperone protein HscB isoform X2 n=1 Tax=Paramormyrops kingsleyae TaxID=1676925 RepID=UPI000CD5F534|nr:iron-sulfur cluster co-chaperone protein HscB, mitochondrial isoform X2 [Paramormyrops kingsleyae]
MQALCKAGLRCLSWGVRNVTPSFSSRLPYLKMVPTMSSAATVALKSTGGLGSALLGSDAPDCPIKPGTVLGGRPRRGLCATPGNRSCWSCGAALGATPVFFCPDCEVVQSPDDRSTYFDIMDCDKSFSVDIRKLQRRYIHLQRSLHPDNFSQKSQREQEYSETQTALINKAYRTLQKPLSRGLYMLELGGVRLEEETGSVADQHHLLEVMELNERLAKTQNIEEANDIGLSVRGKLENLTEQVNTSFRKGDLQSAKVLLAQMKYFVNVEEKVKDKLSESL